MRYENEKCPVCGGVFNENDDVVVCPECATPHHRSCFTENGGCGNEHLHADGFVWKKTEKEEVVETPEIKTEKDEDTVICPECGAENRKNAIGCSNCGMILNERIIKQFETPHQNTVFIEGKPVDDKDFIDSEKTVTVGEAACFIQARKESYIKAFLDAKVNNRKPKFNLSAFLFGPYWFFFRKIYKAGLALAGIMVAILCFVMTFYMQICSEAFSFILENQGGFMQETPDMALYDRLADLITKGVESHPTQVMLIFACFVLMLVVNFAAGIFANKIYLDHIKKSVNKIKSVVPNQSAYFTYLYAKGGTTFLNVFLIGMSIYYLLRFIFSLGFN